MMPGLVTFADNVDKTESKNIKKWEKYEEKKFGDKKVVSYMSRIKPLLEELVKYDKFKIEFIANMSHELKTPLNIIFSTAQLFSVYINNGKTR